MKRFALTMLLVAWASAAHGATQIFAENFEEANPLDTNFPGCAPASSISTNQSHSVTHAAQFYPTGFDQNGACQHSLDAPTKDFYISKWMFIPLGYPGCNSDGSVNGGHAWRFFSNITSGQYAGVQFDTNIHGTAACSASNYDTTPIYLTLDPIFDPSVPSTFWYALELQRGQWNRVEVLFHQGNGNSDGTLMAWVTDNNGTHNWRMNSVVGTGCQACTTTGCTGCNFGNPPGTSRDLVSYWLVSNIDHPNSSMYWYTDDIEIWDACPPTGAACSGTHTADTTPPVRSAGAPSGALPMGTTQTTLSLSTNETATCRYATAAGTAYASMTKNFTTTGQTSHSVIVSGLTNGGAYNYYVRCLDAAGNANQNDYNISFSVSTTVPVSSCASPPPGTIFCDDFENTTIPLATTYSDYDSGNGRFVSTTSEAHSGSHAMSARYDSGIEQSGYIWYNFGRNPESSKTQTTTDFTDIYWRVWMKVQTGFQGNPEKFTRARVIVRPDHTDAATGHIWDGSSLNLLIDPATGIAPDGTTLMTNGFNDFAHYNWLGNANGATQVYDSSHQGRWQCIEAHMKLNTPGASDGVFEMWVDGSLDAQRTGLNWRGSYTAYGINHVSLENWWNGGLAPKTEYRYFDDFMISTQRIGCASGSSGDTTPPQNVTQLRRSDRH